MPTILAGYPNPPMINFCALFCLHPTPCSFPGNGSRLIAYFPRKCGKKIRYLLIKIVVALCGAGALPVHADLMINPTRIVLEKNKRSAQIDIINDGTTTDTYRITLADRRMLESGEFTPVVDLQADEKSSKSMVVYSPHSVVLGPGMQQLIRVAIRKPENLAEGEYRTHLIFERIPDTTPENSIAARGKAVPDAVNVKISALIGVSIPVIVREGNLQAEVALSNLALEKSTAGDAPVLSVEINRSGSRSVYGDFLVTFKTANGVEKTVAQALGVSVYTPNLLRRAKLVLHPDSKVPLQHGVLVITYAERPESAFFDALALPPDVIARQMDVLASQR